MYEGVGVGFCVLLNGGSTGSVYRRNCNDGNGSVAAICHEMEHDMVTIWYGKSGVAQTWRKLQGRMSALKVLHYAIL